MKKKKAFIKVSINGGTPILMSAKNFSPITTKILMHEGVNASELKESLLLALDAVEARNNMFNNKFKPKFKF